MQDEDSREADWWGGCSDRGGCGREEGSSSPMHMHIRRVFHAPEAFGRDDFLQAISRDAERRTREISLLIRRQTCFCRPDLRKAADGHALQPRAAQRGRDGLLRFLGGSDPPT
jgi:hypothetical protein